MYQLASSVQSLVRPRINISFAFPNRQVLVHRWKCSISDFRLKFLEPQLFSPAKLQFQRGLLCQFLNVDQAPLPAAFRKMSLFFGKLVQARESGRNKACDLSRCENIFTKASEKSLSFTNTLMKLVLVQFALYASVVAIVSGFDSFVCGFRFWPILFPVLRFWMNFSSVLRFLVYPSAPLFAVYFLSSSS